MFSSIYSHLEIQDWSSSSILRKVHTCYQHSTFIKELHCGSNGWRHRQQRAGFVEMGKSRSSNTSSEKKRKKRQVGILTDVLLMQSQSSSVTRGREGEHRCNWITGCQTDYLTSEGPKKHQPKTWNTVGASTERFNSMNVKVTQT